MADLEEQFRMTCEATHDSAVARDELMAALGYGEAKMRAVVSESALLMAATLDTGHDGKVRVVMERGATVATHMGTSYRPQMASGGGVRKNAPWLAVR